MNKTSDKRSIILGATLRLINENGFHGTAMSKIAREAGVSAGIIYHYFESKDDLILELYNSLIKELMNALLKGFDNSKSLEDQIKKLFEDIFRYNLANPQAAMFIRQYKASPYYTHESNSQNQQYIDPIVSCVQKAKKQGIIKDLPDTVIAVLTMDVAALLAQRYSAGLVELNDELINEIIGIIWDALKK
ncbi:MAG: TetR/AcrR family transcriptional regulator [Lentisphaerae bacterium]|nr:TetR/AcrR family transcriptional regulator [Lentisphaerota bacterium]MCP4100249.1 TetR/AcrR family transcriptional regulator [Lentisphaerota bacterium]